MKPIVDGHYYKLNNVENGTQEIQFIHKKPVIGESNILKTVQDGTTNEEVLKMLIDRFEFLQAKLPSKENYVVIEKLKDALFWIEKREEDRKKRNVKGKNLL